MPRRKPPLFIDLDETLIYATDGAPPVLDAFKEAKRIGPYTALLRPEAPDLLATCRAGGREVFLFTSAFFNYALAASDAFSLGFSQNTIFSLGMIINCRAGLSPKSALIENKPPSAEPTQEKMRALGITPEQVWLIPSFEPPKFPSAKLFLLGLPHRLERLDCTPR
ncbi:MAG TPA: hypothetical protein VGD88_01705 [Opitutaceae bacterium]